MYIIAPVGCNYPQLYFPPLSPYYRGMREMMGPDVETLLSTGTKEMKLKGNSYLCISQNQQEKIWWGLRGVRNVHTYTLILDAELDNVQSLIECEAYDYKREHQLTKEMRVSRKKVVFYDKENMGNFTTRLGAKGFGTNNGIIEVL